MYAIHCMNNISTVGTDALESAGYEFVDDPNEADAWLVRSANLHEIEAPQSLLAIARAGAGVNNIPVERCAERGIVVFNTPGANSNAVKELVICGMLLACRDIIGGIEWVRDAVDDPQIAKRAEKAKKRFAGCELAGKRVGVIGLGAIGAQVADALIALGAEVMGYDPYLSINAAWGLDRRIEHATDLDQLLAACDFVTLHVPATDATKGMISAEAISKMKRGAVLLNFARDALVDEQALAEALDDGHLARYVTDFANPASANMKNAIVLPHLGASTGEAEDNCAVMAARQLRDYLENGNIANSVNFGRVDLGPLVGDWRIAVFHQNAQGVIGQLSQVLADAGLNIENMSNVSRGADAYTLIEVNGTRQRRGHHQAHRPRAREKGPRDLPERLGSGEERDEELRSLRPLCARGRLPRARLRGRLSPPRGGARPEDRLHDAGADRLRALRRGSTTSSGAPIPTSSATGRASAWATPSSSRYPAPTSRSPPRSFSPTRTSSTWSPARRTSGSTTPLAGTSTTSGSGAAARIDIKEMLMGELEAVELLLVRNGRPRRTVILAFGEDEEVTSRGATALAAELARPGRARGLLARRGRVDVLPTRRPTGRPGPRSSTSASRRRATSTCGSLRPGRGGHSSNPFGGTSLERICVAVAAPRRASPYAAAHARRRLDLPRCSRRTS